MKKTINFILYMIIFMFGIFGIMIASHEGYHYLFIDGDPTGICVGKCDLGDSYKDSYGDTWSTAAITWNFTQEQYDKTDQLKEERDAWIFAIAFTALIMGLFLYSGKK